MNEIIIDYYCNGFFGRRYDLEGSEIIFETDTSITIRDNNGQVESCNFTNLQQKEEYKKEWT